MLRKSVNVLDRFSQNVYLLTYTKWLEEIASFRIQAVYTRIIRIHKIVIRQKWELEKLDNSKTSY